MLFLRQPVAQLLQSLLQSHVELENEDKLALIHYHYRNKHGIDLSEHEVALATWLIAAGAEHKGVIDALDQRPQQLRLIPEAQAAVTVSSHRGEGTLALAGPAVPPGVPVLPPPQAPRAQTSLISPTLSAGKQSMRDMQPMPDTVDAMQHDEPHEFDIATAPPSPVVTDTRPIPWDMSGVLDSGDLQMAEPPRPARSPSIVTSIHLVPRRVDCTQI